MKVYLRKMTHILLRGFEINNLHHFQIPVVFATEDDLADFPKFIKKVEEQYFAMKYGAVKVHKFFFIPFDFNLIWFIF